MSLVVLGPAAAAAQPVISTEFRSRTDGRSPQYPGATTGAGININDCCTAPDGVGYTFRVSGTNFDPGDQFHFWVGNECNLAINRNSTLSPPPCVRVGTPVAAAATGEYPLYARDILGQANRGVPGCPADLSGNATLWFLVMLDTTIDARASVSFTVPYDLDPPAPPLAVSAGAGEGRVVVRWTAPDETDLNGYYILCDPNDRSIGIVAGPICVASGADAGDGGAGCTAGGLLGGASFTDAASYACAGPVGANSTEYWVDGLMNGRSYNVAVAAIDDFDNVSASSDIACATPAPVRDFWEAYCAARGRACPPGCSTPGRAGGSRTVLPFVLAGALGLLGLALLLRRRRA